MTLASGGDLHAALKALRDGEVLELAERGTYTGAALYDHAGKVAIRGNGATIRGGPQALKFERVPFVTAQDLLLTEADIGLALIQCGGYAVRTVQALRNRIHGILTAHSSHGLIEGCNCSVSKEQHGIYLSESGDDVTIRNCSLFNNRRAGLQVNAVQESGTRPGNPNLDSISRNIRLLGNTLSGNQVAGGAGINLAGVYDSEVRGNRILDHQGRHGIALFDGETGKAKYACHGVLIDGNEFGFRSGAPTKPVACISIGRGCTKIDIGNGNHYPAGVTPVENQ